MAYIRRYPPTKSYDLGADILLAAGWQICYTLTMQMLTPTKQLRHPWKLKHADQKEYDAAWDRFWKLGAKLQKLWKTKKSGLQILREERAS